MSELIEVTVARGRSLEVDGRRILPGETAMVPEAEAERLRVAGFIVDRPTGEQPAPRRL